MNKFTPNPQGGIDPSDKADLERAKEADLITLPPQTVGTNCGNCKFFQPVQGGIMGKCTHPKLKTLVTSRMCCKFWDSVDTLRAWKKE